MKVKLRTRLLTAIMGIALFAAAFTGLFAVGKANDEFEEMIEETTTNTATLMEYLLELQFPGRWKVTDGELHKGEVNFTNQPFVDQMKKETGTYLMFCAGSTEVMGNMDGFIIDETISKQVLAGKTVMKSGALEEKELMVCYKPLLAEDGTVVGMFLVAADKESKEQGVASVRSVCRNLSGITLIIAFMIAFYIAEKILKPINGVKRQLVKMSDNDFTVNEELNSKFRGTEIIEMAEAVKTLCASMAAMVGHIKQESEAIDQAASSTNDSLLQLNGSVDEVSASTEEISAGMEEASAGTEQVLTTVNVMVTQVQDIAGNVKTGEARATEIFDRANAIKQDAIAAKEQANIVMKTGKERMDQAIKESEKINRIKELTDTITGIAGQTKLLSLNASIEAARAGEAGKGFAVVADEIRDLSEASQQAVNSIREVAELVLNAVNELVEVSKQTVDELGGNANTAYERLVTTGETYQDDSVFISEFLEEIKRTFDQVEVQIESMTEAMGQMSDVVAESAQGTTLIAGHAAEIAGEVSGILTLSEKTKESSMRLMEFVKAVKYEE